VVVLKARLVDGYSTLIVSDISVPKARCVHKAPITIKTRSIPYAMVDFCSQSRITSGGVNFT